MKASTFAFAEGSKTATLHHGGTGLPVLVADGAGHYPTETELALVTGVEVSNNVLIKKCAFHGEDLVLASSSFWERASRYIHVGANGDRVVLPVSKTFADEIQLLGLDDSEWQHGAERLAVLISTALRGGYKNILIALL